MRHPFWKWTKWVSWLSVGLSGCLHGQDWRAAVLPPRVRQVADRREAPPQPKVIGPRRTTKPNFVPPNSIPTPNSISPVNSVPAPVAPKAMPRLSGSRVGPSHASRPSVTHGIPPAIVARPLATTASGMISASHQFQNEPIQPSTTRDEAQPRGAKVVAVEFVPPPAPPAAPPSRPLPAPMPLACLTATPSASAPRAVNLENAHADGVGVQPANVPSPSALVSGRAIQTQAPGVFAEFERQIPRRKIDMTRVPDVSAQPDPSDEIVVVPEREPTPSPALPVIIPARTFMSTTYQPIVPQPLPLPIPPLATQELSDMPETGSLPSESPSAGQDPPARPRDVAVLVEQVFEDLRQRRLDEARQRTQWLKQLVAKRLPVPQDISTEAPISGRDEPQRLHVDPRAAPADKVPSEIARDHQVPTNHH